MSRARFYKHSKRGYFHKAPGRGYWCSLRSMRAAALTIAIRRPFGSMGGWNGETCDGDAVMAVSPRKMWGKRRLIKNGRWDGPWRDDNGP